MSSGLEKTYESIYPLWLAAQYNDVNNDGIVQSDDRIEFTSASATTITVDAFIAGYVGSRYQDDVKSLMGRPIEEFIKLLNLLPSNTNGFPKSN